MSMAHVSLGDGSHVVSLDDVDSTNAEAMRRVGAGERGPLWICAERQSAGRGRSGRKWQSPIGNLYASLLISLNCPLSLAQQLSLLAGVATVDAIRLAMADDTPNQLRLKWPNDLMIGSDKVGGILIETTGPLADGVVVAVIGVGLNLVTAPEDTTRPATSLAGHGAQLERLAFLALLAKAMKDWQKTWLDGERFDLVRAAWLERGLVLGTGMSVHAGALHCHGEFAGLDVDGALLLRGGDDKVQRFTFGDVTLAATSSPD